MGRSTSLACLLLGITLAALGCGGLGNTSPDGSSAGSGGQSGGSGGAGGAAGGTGGADEDGGSAGGSGGQGQGTGGQPGDAGGGATGGATIVDGGLGSGTGGAGGDGACADCMKYDRCCMALGQMSPDQSCMRTAACLRDMNSQGFLNSGCKLSLAPLSAAPGAPAACQ